MDDGLLQGAEPIRLHGRIGVGSLMRVRQLDQRQQIRLIRAKSRSVGHRRVGATHRAARRAACCAGSQFQEPLRDRLAGGGDNSHGARKLRSSRQSRHCRSSACAHHLQFVVSAAASRSGRHRIAADQLRDCRRACCDRTSVPGGCAARSSSSLSTPARHAHGAQGRRCYVGLTPVRQPLAENVQRVGQSVEQPRRRRAAVGRAPAGRRASVSRWPARLPLSTVET